jgi:hypothetical protein
MSQQELLEVAYHTTQGERQGIADQKMPLSAVTKQSIDNNVLLIFYHEGPGSKRVRVIRYRICNRDSSERSCLSYNYQSE